MLAAACNNSWKLLAYNTTLGHALARLSTQCEPDGVTVLSGIVQRKDPGHQGVSLSNLLSLDGGRQLSHRAQVKLEMGLVQLEDLGADLTL
jgi:hypothetical protein